MNVLRLESRVASVTSYLARLKVVVSRIDSSLWPRETLQNDLEYLMARLNEVAGRVQQWKRSSARCGADVALSLVRVHSREAREEKLAVIKVANTKGMTSIPSWRLLLLPPLELLTGLIWTSSSSLQVLLLPSEQT